MTTVTDNHQQAVDDLRAATREAHEAIAALRATPAVNTVDRAYG